MTQLSLLAFMVACGPRAEEPPEAQKYTEVLSPLLADNGLLADILWNTADLIYSETSDNPLVGPVSGDSAKAKALFQVWNQDIAPLTAHLHDQATLVEPPESWIDAHAALVVAWGCRADSYRDIGEALILQDASALAAAKSSADHSKHLEEQWFRHVNKRLSPYDLHLNQYPRSPKP